MKKLLNQIVASEGVYHYDDLGGPIYKPWDMIKSWIGHKLIIVDGHPADEKSAPTFGEALLKKCPIGKNILCADIFLNDNAPIRKGFSLAYTADIQQNEGKFGNTPFKMVMAPKGMPSHLALVDDPRDTVALRTDATSPTIKEGVNKYAYICDSIIPSEPKDDRKMSAEIVDDSKELKARLAKTEADLKDATEKAIKAEASRKALEENMLKVEAARVKIIVDGLVKTWELEVKDFDNRSIDFIEGVKWFSDQIMEKPKSTATVVDHEGSHSLSVHRMKLVNGKLEFE